MTRRNIVHIDEEKCDGCGQCVDACAEGAIQLANGKAKLISETYCDGLGACIGECPQGAITVEERDSQAFDPEAVKRHLAEGVSTAAPLPCGCPGSAVRTLEPAEAGGSEACSDVGPSQLTNWPVQIKLVPITAPYLAGAKVTIAADCVACAFPGFHQRFIKGRVLLIGCPKLDDAEFYADKLAAIFKQNDIVAVEVAHMEVPCCFGLVKAVQSAVKASGKSIPLTVTKVGVTGGILDSRDVIAAHV